MKSRTMIMDRIFRTIILALISFQYAYMDIQADVRNWPKRYQYDLIKKLASNSTNPSKTLPFGYNLHCLTDRCVRSVTVNELKTRPIVGQRIERPNLPPTHLMYDVNCKPIQEPSSDYRLLHPYTDSSQPITTTKTFNYPLSDDHDMRYVTGHVTTINQPEFLKVLEPGGRGGCRRSKRIQAAETASTKRCLAAMSAGFFDVFYGSCMGNTVSEGIQVSNSTVKNAHFGITNQGMMFIGYLGLGDVSKLGFRELVNGIIWIVKDGKNNVDKAIREECIATAKEEEDAVNRFIQIGARAAVGHDKEGRIILVNVNGKTYQRGMTLYEFADFLIFLGVENAVNLDGGGSVTLVLNGTLVSQPADLDSVPYVKTRTITTVLCAHAPYCRKERCYKPGTYMVDEECLCYNIL